MSVLFVCLTVNSILFAQRVDDMLSKEEMNKEFDYIIELVSEVNPHLSLYEQMMGYDVIEEMKKQREDIDKVENWAEYYKFLSLLLNKVPEGHTRMLLNASDYYKERYPYLADSLAQGNAKKVGRDYEEYMSDIDKRLNKLIAQYGSFHLTYIDGRFYNVHAFNNNRRRERIATGWELVKINGDKIADFMKKSPFNYLDRNRWDVNNKMSYNVHPTLVDACFALDVYGKSIIRNDLTLTFRNSSNKEKSVTFATIDEKKQPYHYFVGFVGPK